MMRMWYTKEKIRSRSLPLTQFMIPLSLFLDLPDMVIEPIEITAHTLTLSLAPETSEAACPLCEHPSQRVHSRYQRMLQDLPCGGKILRLRVQVIGRARS